MIKYPKPRLNMVDYMIIEAAKQGILYALKVISAVAVAWGVVFLFFV